MSAVDNNNLDELVEIIVDRVRRRLAREPAAPPGPETPTAAPLPTGACPSCCADSAPQPWALRAGSPAATASHAPADVSTPSDLAGLIDHTLLKPEATRAEIEQLCEEARIHGFASVCVNTTWGPLCKQRLRDTPVKVCCVVGFPLGAMAPTAKAFEAREAVQQGADEVDMVMNLGAMKSRDFELVFEDMSRVVRAAAPAVVKVILETSTLETEEKLIGCTLAKLAGAHFVKTSTGFASGGATVEDIALMRKTVGDTMGIKASGGVRTAEDALRMTRAGATRIGASSSIAIVTGQLQGGRTGAY